MGDVRTIHSSRNLRIEFDPDEGKYRVAVTFHEETIAGEAEGRCPRCGGDTQLTLWELEGPGGGGNTLWLVCAAETVCLLDGVPLRWSSQVTFEGDWEDV